MDRKIFAHWFIKNVNFQFDCESCKKFDCGKNCRCNQKSACRLVKKYIKKLMEEDIAKKFEKKVECEYCNLEKYYEHMFDENALVKILDRNDYTHMEIQYDKIGELFNLVAIGDDKTEFKISHCPRCGRKLGGD